jgi:hypothetical protein
MLAEHEINKKNDKMTITTPPIPTRMATPTKPAMPTPTRTPTRVFWSSATAQYDGNLAGGKSLSRILGTI